MSVFRVAVGESARGGIRAGRKDAVESGELRKKLWRGAVPWLRSFPPAFRLAFPHTHACAPPPFDSCIPRDVPRRWSEGDGNGGQEGIAGDRARPENGQRGRRNEEGVARWMNEKRGEGEGERSRETGRDEINDGERERERES